MDQVQYIIDFALTEDIGPGDITTDNLIDESQMGKGIILAKQKLIVCGADVVKKVFHTLDSNTKVKSFMKDGEIAESGDVMFEIEGTLRTLLKGERTALNFLQRLSGIATNTKSFVELMGDSKARLVDTRKITPGLRVLEKYAVTVGGAYNHRTALYDGVMIKDNHIAVSGGIKKAVATVREKISHLVKIEVEVSNMDELSEALEAKADVIMLDNMDLKQIKEAVAFVKGKAVLEVSGLVTKKNLKELSETGVDIISSGALTHQAQSVDISMRIQNL
ncbi:MAG: carboxylating nicotinate-nucleotide diphosphorylase [Desulfobacterales bacterium]|nr:carboxylating nicotinate-nucleotide diphosphorylase [Desulfobacterales bacterium]MCP4163518.1 carboxylating nicotinate-nucleotide diphosphorylase [Deltaproteobacteria bacterium]